MTPVYFFEEMRLPIELLASSLIFFLPFAPKKRGFLPRAVGFFAAFTLFSLLYFPLFGPKETPRLEYLIAFWYALIGLFGAFYGKLCFEVTWTDALFLGIAAFLTQNVVYCTYHCFVARILYPAIREDLLLYITGAVLATVPVLLLVWIAFRKPLRASAGALLNDSRGARINLAILFVLMLVCLLFYQNAFENRESAFDRLAWLSGVVICFFLLLILYAIIRNILNIREAVTLENMLRSSERYYEMSKEHIAIINRKCHDLKHQLKALARADEAEREAYIKEAQESVDFYRTLVYTDNEALNTILAEKGLFCREKNIDFNCAADDADLSFIRLPDLYALLGNAIDNAIEYTERQEDPALRSISVRISRKGGFIGIQVTNPYAGAVLSPDVFPETKKPNPSDHGFGMKSIRYLAEKYGGTMEYSTEDRLFTLQILLPARAA